MNQAWIIHHNHKMCIEQNNEIKNRSTHTIQSIEYLPGAKSIQWDREVF